MASLDSEVVGGEKPDEQSPTKDQPSTAPSDSSPLVVSQPLTPAPQAHDHTASQRLRDLQDATLRFFANASNETLGACAVGLCASTYLVLGRVGLVLIGAVGGIVLHATWEQNQHTGDDEKGRAEAVKRRKEQGLELAKRVLDWRELNIKQQEDNSVLKIETSLSNKELDYSGFQSDTKQALEEFTDAVIRDYVRWWYSPILPADNAFPATCRQVLTGFILSFANHVSRRRTEDPFLDFMANSTSIIIVFLNEIGNAVKASPNQDVATAIKTYLEYEPDSSLANVLSSKQQDRKLRLVAEDILQNFLDSKTYNCVPAQTFLREVLATLILQATINSCSKPEWINGWIVYLLEDGEPEIMNVIDSGVEDLGDSLATSRARDAKSTEGQKHQRRVSKAEEAMQEAMREAQRLNEMIAEDDARRRRGESILETESIVSATTTDAGIPTPTSSDSEMNVNVPEPVEETMIFDAEGNNIPSGTSTPARLASPIRQKPKQFTSFDQLGPTVVPTAIQPELSPPPPTESMSATPLTLHNAIITILDMGDGNDKVQLRQPPRDEMLVQVEPASSRFPGWMVTRKYPDFEPLHERLLKIAPLSGVYEFNQKHPTVPAWRGQTRSQLIGSLETYLNQVLKYERLAESEGMKKFLDKDIGLSKAPSANKNVLLQGAAALDNVGKGFINVIGQGGKNIAGGGKAVFGGVQGVFGAVGSAVGGPKKIPSPARPAQIENARSNAGGISVMNSGRPSLDFVSGASPSEEVPPQLPPRQSTSSVEQTSTPFRVTALQSEELLNLPPPPSDITEDYVPIVRPSGTSHKTTPSITSKPSRPSTPTQNSALSTNISPTIPQSDVIPSITAATGAIEKASASSAPTATTTTAQIKKSQPLTEEETRITIDLLFAIITQTYSLSSAWAFRLSLLSAAKTFLLRPNNPQLDSIRTLLQESLINNNTSDTAIANHIRKLRENTLPTEEELAKWPKEMSVEEKEKLRLKARKLLVERGMPQALTSVMGQAASGEALGKVFDCLQEENVARGLMFAVMLQGIRAMMQ